MVLHYKIGGPTIITKKFYLFEHECRVWLLADLMNSSNLLVAIHYFLKMLLKGVFLFRTEYYTDRFPLSGFQQRVSRFLGFVERHQSLVFQIFTKMPDREYFKYSITF